MKNKIKTEFTDVCLRNRNVLLSLSIAKLTTKNRLIDRLIERAMVWFFFLVETQRISR